VVIPDAKGGATPDGVDGEDCSKRILREVEKFVQSIMGRENLLD